MKLLDFRKKPSHILADLSRPSKEQLKFLKKCYPMVCTPVREGRFMGNYMMAISSLQKWSTLLGLPVDIQTMMGVTYIEFGRNVLANTFWKSECTHLVFIDSDIGFITNNFFELLLCDKDIVGGMYTRRKINWHAVHKAVLEGVPPECLEYCAGDFPIHTLKDHPVRIESEPQKVLTLPTGFFCISRKALELYHKSYPEMVSTPGNPGYYGIQFFRSGTITCDDGTKGHDSEDNLFCKDMLKLGVNTWVCPWMDLTHYGDHLFKARFADSAGAYLSTPGWLEKQTGNVEKTA